MNQQLRCHPAHFVRVLYPLATTRPAAPNLTRSPVSWSRFNDAITTYAYLKRKSNVILSSRSLSADGNVLTFSEKTFDEKGKQTGTAVMVFAKPGFEVATVTPPRVVTPPRASDSAVSPDA